MRVDTSVRSVIASRCRKDVNVPRARRLPIVSPCPHQAPLLSCCCHDVQSGVSGPHLGVRGGPRAWSHGWSCRTGEWRPCLANEAARPLAIHLTRVSAPYRCAQT